jgi:large subunit ribosomal protein L18
MLEKTRKRLKRKDRVKAKLSFVANRPRLSVFRSNIHIFVQLIDDEAGKTLAAASDLKIKKE